MLSMQHVLCGTLAKNRPGNNYMGALVYPDAVRAYTGRREYTHFEENSDGTQVSGWKFPPNMKLTKEEVQKQLAQNGHLSEGIRPAAIGEKTHIERFEKENGHLPSEMYLGIKDHLAQDSIFDDFIRDEIDCSGKYEDRYVFRGQAYDGKGIRKVIGDIEQHGVYTLAHKLYEEKGITADQAWFERQVKPTLDAAYSQELSDKTFSFMRMSPEVDGWIRNHDWTHLSEGPVDQSHYDKLYRTVLDGMDRNAKEQVNRSRVARAESLLPSGTGPMRESYMEY